jgi:hypothetical protein
MEAESRMKDLILVLRRLWLIGLGAAAGAITAAVAALVP